MVHNLLNPLWRKWNGLGFIIGYLGFFNCHSFLQLEKLVIVSNCVTASSALEKTQGPERIVPQAIAQPVLI